MNDEQYDICKFKNGQWSVEESGFFRYSDALFWMKKHQTTAGGRWAIVRVSRTVVAEIRSA